MIGTKEDADSKKEAKRSNADAGKVLFLTCEEALDPKNASKRAHRSISPKYDSTGLIGYNIGNYTVGYIKYLEAEKKRKKQAN